MPPPILVLGLGNQLLSDDGAGLELLARLSRSMDTDGRIEFLDGGTGGLALLGPISDRRALVILDAVRTGSEPGTLHVLTGEELSAFLNTKGSTAHETSAGELLQTAMLAGCLPEQVCLIGIEPADNSTGIELSDPVRAGLDRAQAAACEVLSRLATKEKY